MLASEVSRACSVDQSLMVVSLEQENTADQTRKLTLAVLRHVEDLINPVSVLVEVGFEFSLQVMITSYLFKVVVDLPEFDESVPARSVDICFLLVSLLRLDLVSLG